MCTVTQALEAHGCFPATIEAKCPSCEYEDILVNQGFNKHGQPNYLCGECIEAEHDGMVEQAEFEAMQDVPPHIEAGWAMDDKMDMYRNEY